MNRLFILAMLFLLPACSADEPTPTAPPVAPAFDSAEAHRLSMALMEKWTDCQLDAARYLATTKMPAEDAAQAAFKKCVAEKEAWVTSQIGGNVTRSMAADVTDKTERCMIQITTRFIDHQRSRESVKDFKEWASIYDVSTCK